ncbi:MULTISPECIES: ferredoxin [unclassified Saccharopolyspora]|uniref:ferredoxin n=1 Tax=unclassified Saccharopolyspora TaxID=2646250 RepID=UPI001CD44E20|nr:MULTISPECIES: ferredoxin [unclassified Saccharopolyspora]MCA1188958.1 ferredoxin [Saccharopolyspora sp. 6T]MCA1195679.1 ferredoxin [Saccharopolyspora sp. 6V]MCA1227165.1 ferredoxin [Saccharopolyspora sp. 6M]MCA1280378.1 ferredoxin [Saccharopolyspora sp. 7B]
MEIGVRPELCEANGVCAGLAPEVFELDEDERLHVHRPVPAERVERVTKAVQLCPKGALYFVEGTDELGS